MCRFSYVHRPSCSCMYSYLPEQDKTKILQNRKTPNPLQLQKSCGADKKKLCQNLHRKGNVFTWSILICNKKKNKRGGRERERKASASLPVLWSKYKVISIFQFDYRSNNWPSIINMQGMHFFVAAKWPVDLSHCVDKCVETHCTCSTWEHMHISYCPLC